MNVYISSFLCLCKSVIQEFYICGQQTMIVLTFYSLLLNRMLLLCYLLRRSVERRVVVMSLRWWLNRVSVLHCLIFISYWKTNFHLSKCQNAQKVNTLNYSIKVCSSNIYSKLSKFKFCDRNFTISVSLKGNRSTDWQNIQAQWFWSKDTAVKGAGFLSELWDEQH